MIVLHTPGHHEVTDTLIMYGLVEVIKTYRPFSAVKIIPSGDRYLIQTDLDKDAILKALEYYARNRWFVKTYLSRKPKEDKPSRNYVLSLFRKLPSTLKIHMLQRGNEEKQFKNIIDSLEFLSNIKTNIESIFGRFKNKYDLIDRFLYISENHRKIEGGEKIEVLCGKRSKSGRYPVIVANLPIAPFGGTVQKVGAYRLCKLCVALAWIGLFYFSSRITVNSENTQHTYIHVFKPENLANGNIILMLRNIAQISFFRTSPLKKSGKDLVAPSIVIPLVLLSFGETSGALLETEWKSITYVLSGERRANTWRTAIRSVKVFQINSLMSFVEKAKTYSGKYVRLVDSLSKSEDGLLSLSMLSEAIIYHDIDRLYTAIRQIRNVLAQKGSETLLDEGIIKAAFEVLT